LSGIWAAVSAGIGLTVRTTIGLPPNLKAFPFHEHQLPSLDRIGLKLHRAEAEPSEAIVHLEEIIRHHLDMQKLKSS
jgi:hypothetical protein